MAQESMVEEAMEPPHSLSNDPSSPLDSVSCLSRSSSSSSSSSRLNAGAPEFVPRSSNRTDTTMPRLVVHAAAFSGPPPPTPTSPLFHVPYNQTYGGGGAGGGGFVKQQEIEPEPEPQPLLKSVDPPPVKNGLSEEIRHKILNQVEYYFSDVNLATTDHLIRFINKDPDGFVPISVVASFKKIKALVSSHHQLATVLRKSSKLVISDDGKKVKRQHPLTESDMEDVQSRIVVAENLPEDHSYQNLMRVFSAVGSVKTIRTCQPQTSNAGASAVARLSKMENMLFSNKLHAFVEYETVEMAEKAVSGLNDEMNWRSGLRMRLLLQRKSKPAQTRGRKFAHEGEGTEEDDLSTSEQLNDKHLEHHSQSTDVTSHEHTADDSIHDKEGSARKNRGGRGRGKGRGRGQHHNNRGNHVGTPPASIFIHNEQSIVTKQPPGPRMPDGTRGFAMGRGKPIVS